MTAYEMNRLMYDLRLPDNRDAIRASLNGYLDCYDITESEKRLVRNGDWQGLVEAGVSVYVLTKIGAALDVSLYEMGASMREMSMDDFWKHIAEQNDQCRPFAILPA